MGIWLQRDGNDLITKHKVRWVVKEFKQCYGVDYSDTYASVVMSTTYSVAFAIAAYLQQWSPQASGRQNSIFKRSTRDEGIWYTAYESVLP